MTDRQLIEPIYTLSIASKLSGVATHSIRQYIEKGLIIPFKTSSNRHLFSEIDITRLKCIKTLIHDHGINIAGIKALHALLPCWAIKPCQPEEREHCGAYNSQNEPCWEASDKSVLCKNTDCRTCHVYTYANECDDIKSLLKRLIK